MKKFVFRLARLERLRELRRKQARTELARALNTARDAGRRREACRQQLDQALDAELPADVAVEPSAWKQLVEWRAGRRRLAEHAARCEAEARKVVEAAAAEHASKARDHRVIEKLRERRFRRWLEEAEMDERKTLDESHRLRLRGRGEDRR